MLVSLVATAGDSAKHSYTTVSPLTIDVEIFQKVVTVLDATIANSEDIFAVRPSTNDATIFLEGRQIHAYLTSLETDSTKTIIVDFSSFLADAPPAASTSKTTNQARKAEAKIEDAHQLAIGVKKEVDFASWYTNVSSMKHNLGFNWSYHRS